MRFGLDVSQHQLTWHEILHRAQMAEELRFDGVWVFDHFKPLYADPNGPCLEAYTLLAGLAAATSRVRLGSLVTGATYRHPSILATEAITVDHISDGRLELALGAAWFEREHRELGFEFPSTAERVRRLEETIDVLRFLMTADNANFQGRFFRLDDATYHPRPVQKPHPPIWIGASGERLMLPLVARVADVWHHSGSAEEVIRKSRLLDSLATDAGRDPAEIMRAGSVGISDLDVAGRKLEQLSGAGFGYVVVDWPAEGEEQVRRFADETMPQFAGSAS